ncbi:hypothetical protein GGI05_003377, partial [Coemansia sp. RSA 2603]
LLLGQRIELNDQLRVVLWAFGLTDGMELQVIQMILQMPEHTRQSLWQQTRQLAQQQVQGWNPELAQRWEPELTQMIERVEQRNQQQLFEQTQQSTQEQEQEQEEIETTEQIQEEIEMAEQPLAVRSVQELVQEFSQVQQTTRQALRESTQQLTPEPEHEQEQEQELVQSPASDSDNGDVYSKYFNVEQPPPNNVDQADKNDLVDMDELFSSNNHYELSELTTVKRRSLEYTPRCALVHQFMGMDSETVISYGDDKLQLWDPVSKSIVREWDGGLQNVHIGQIEPISPSMLAMVSSGAGENEQVSKAGRLMFTDLNWSTETNRFSDMTVRQWVDDEPPVEDISVVECAQSQDAENELQVSLFTGSMTDGAVYRRKFDFSKGEAELIEQQSMLNDHDRAISALCHVETQKCVISGTTFGDICINDHESGSHVHNFNLALHGTVLSITRCPFNPFLFMVGSCLLLNELAIFDLRDMSSMLPKLLLHDAGSTVTAPSNKPKWDSETGLILAPVRRNVNGRTTATINMWDPGWVKRNNPKHYGFQDEHEVFSVDFTTPADVKQRIMVTASENTINFTTSRIQNY